MSNDVINWLLVLEQVKIDYKAKLWERHQWSRNQAFQLYLDTLSIVIVELGSNAEQFRLQNLGKNI